MNLEERIADYKLDSPRVSRFSEERFLLFLEDVTAVFDGFKALDIEALGIAQESEFLDAEQVTSGALLLLADLGELFAG